MRNFSSLLAGVAAWALSSCATPIYDVPAPRDVAVARAEVASIRLAYDEATARRARVYDLTFPVLAANAEICPRIKNTLGVVLSDRKGHARLSGGLRAEDVAALGVPDDLHLYHVYAGSPAAAAGLRRGDLLIRVGAEKTSTPDAASAAIRARAQDGPVELTVRRQSTEQQVTVVPRSTCDMAVKISSSGEVNAHAGTGDIVINQGLIRVLNDDALQFVIAHEAAHLAAHHPRKYSRNLVVTGAVITGPALFSAAWIGDAALRLVGAKPEVSLRRRALRQSAPWASAFEAEADYLGAYFLARAGGDLQGAIDAFEAFAVESPRSIHARSTHPLIPERLAALELIAEEIRARAAAGQPLIPNARDDHAREPSAQ